MSAIRPCDVTRRAAAIGTAATLTALIGHGAGAATPALDIGTLVRRIQASTRQRSFTGTYVVSQGGSVTSSRIVHYCDGRDQIERIEALDGQTRRVFRHNDVVHVIWPATRTALIEQRELIGRFPTPLQPGDDARLEMYELQASGEDRVADHEAQVYTFRPRDGLRYARRLWLERRTGLPLRSDLLGEQGEVIESVAFTHLQIGPKLQPQQLLQDMHRLDGYRVSRPVYTPSDLGAEGWALRQPVAGFEAGRVVRRPVGAWPRHAAAAASADPDDARMLQAVFSDGLTHVSVFIEPYSPALHRREAPASVGSTHAISRRQGDWWITAVGAVPMPTLQQFVNSLERRRP
ncbi:MAG: hypothetical protein RL456_1284 [Pseudomonadota bacterium]